MIIFTPASSFAQIDPVSCPVAGSLETFGVNKGFKEIDRVVVNSLPILRKNFANAA